MKYLKSINESNTSEMIKHIKFCFAIKRFELNINENKKFDVDKFNTFIKRYKSSDYISKTGIKRLKDIGIDQSFFNIEEKVKECLNFINIQNEELLKDILLDALDNVTDLDYDSSESYISIEPEYPLNHFEFIIQNDLKDNIEFIIKEVDRLFKNEIEKQQSSLDKKDKYYFRYKQNISRLKNFYDKLKIKPKLLLKFNYIERINMMDYQEHREWFYKVSNSLKNSIKNEEVIERYLDSIGYKDLKFRINYNFDKYYEDKVSISIVFDI